MLKLVLSMVSAITIVLSMAGGGSTSAGAQGAGWTPAQRVPGYAADAEVPHLIADQNRTVHALTSQAVKGRSAVVYRRWSLQGNWTNPVDVLLSPQPGTVRLAGAYLDPAGTIHVAYFGGNDTNMGIYYSSAPATVADRAPSWLRPVLIGERAGPVSPGISYGALVGDDKGNLFVLYSGTREGPGLYFVRSADWGDTWSEPAAVFLTGSERHQVAFVHALLDSAARLHVAWTVVNASGTGDGVYYSRLEEDLVDWSRPILLATRTEYSAERPILIEHDNELLVTYSNGLPPIHWMSRSSDNGLTWSKPVHILEGWLGGNGSVSLIHDSKNVLHVFFGNRTIVSVSPYSAIHGTWHSTWDGTRWSTPEAVDSRPPVSSEEGMAFDPWDPRVVVSQGNVLLVTWVTDPGAGRNGVWYSYTTLDAPELPVAPLATPQFTPTPVVTRTTSAVLSLAPAPTSTRPMLTLSDAQGIDSERPPVISTSQRWVLGIMPVVLLIAVVIGAKALLSSRR